MATNESAIDAGVKVKSKGWLGRILKGLLIAVAGGIVILGVAHLAWKYSGSGQWELVMEKGAAKVYRLKEPGTTLEKFKGVTRIKSTLNRAVASMMDASLENCHEWIDICAGSTAVEPWNRQGLYYTQLYRENFPSPFGPREFLIKLQFSQDPITKTVQAAYIALPDLLPRNACCRRVEQMNNTWHFTPVSADELDVELVQDMDIQIPYFLYNRESAAGILDTMVRLPTYFNKDKYKDAKWDFIQAP